MKRILFIDRDGTLIKEAPPTYQIDSLDKLAFYPHVFEYMGRIVRELDYELVMITNQDGLGTDSYPEHTFWPIQEFVINTFAGEGITFSNVFIDKTFAAENAHTRKPNIGLVKHFLGDESYDVKNSFVIGDRITDVQLAKNLGCRAIWLSNEPELGLSEVAGGAKSIQDVVALETSEWKDIYQFLKLGIRHVVHERNTHETQIKIDLNLDGSGKSNIVTGLGFFDHMLDQIARHGRIDLTLRVNGDLQVDEHHTVEDTGIALGEAFAMGLADKRGMTRYGFALPMDDAEAKVLVDFGGRNWIVWHVDFRREMIGDVPTEMFFHFFKSFSDAAKCNLNVECRGENEHHKIEAVFKAFARAIRMAVTRDPLSNHLPSTKGIL